MEKKSGTKLEKLTLDLGKVARVSKTTAKQMQRGKSQTVHCCSRLFNCLVIRMSRSAHQRRTLFEEKGETDAELSVRRLCGRGEIWVCMSPYSAPGIVSGW
jgi:hypothetical protein